LAFTVRPTFVNQQQHPFQLINAAGMVFTPTNVIEPGRTVLLKDAYEYEDR
jgi:hypothetical protein